MLSIVDRTYIINTGNIIADGLPNEILHNEKARQIYLGEEFTL
jgi:lipopolysaccharide export system ATP-binding protein